MSLHVPHAHAGAAGPEQRAALGPELLGAEAVAREQEGCHVGTAV